MRKGRWDDGEREEEEEEKSITMIINTKTRSQTMHVQLFYDGFGHDLVAISFSSSRLQKIVKLKQRGCSPVQNC